MALNAFGVYSVSAKAMDANVSCVCDKCGHKESQEGIIVVVLFNASFKYVLSHAPYFCPKCHDEFSDTAFFGTPSEASQAIMELVEKLAHAQRDKDLAVKEICDLVPILPAIYDHPPDATCVPNVLNS